MTYSMALFPMTFKVMTFTYYNLQAFSDMIFHTAMQLMTTQQEVTDAGVFYKVLSSIELRGDLAYWLL